MAAALSVGKQLQEEATCPVCLDFFTDPVTLDCGHNFCRACIAQCWGEPPTVTACPQCRESFQPRNVKPNRQLANMVALLKEFSVQAKQEAGGERVCERHQEPLKLFCKDDEALICVVCDRSKEHRAHNVIPVPEAAQEYQDQFCSFLELLRKGREKILACKVDAEKESQKLFNQIVAERQKTVAEFRQLHKFLEEQETLLLTQIVEAEKAIARRKDEHMATLSEELSSLDKVIQEMEEKCGQSASELLQDVRSTLKRCKEKERFENHVAFPPSVKRRTWDFGRNTFLENVIKQFKDNLSGFLLQRADVTLDPDTAHPRLILTEDRKCVRWGEKLQDLPKNPERFSYFCCVLGCEGFTAGRHCWEVTVGSEGVWALGVARKSVKRKNTVRLGPEEGIWAVRKLAVEYHAIDFPADIPLHLSGKPKRIRVTLNYAEGQVAFLDADSAAPIYTFSKASFSGETLLPFFWVGMEATLTLSLSGSSPPGREGLAGKRNSACGVGAMAVALSVGRQLQDEATCPVCLDFFTDPVTLDCGHNFCQACIAQCWGEPPTVTACPQCRESFQPRNVKPNRQLANMVAIAKELNVQLKQQLGGWRVCEGHQEPLNLFCKEDEAPICVVCDRSKEHRAHNVVPVPEAAQEYQVRTSHLTTCVYLGSGRTGLMGKLTQAWRRWTKPALAPASARKPGRSLPVPNPMGGKGFACSNVDKVLRRNSPEGLHLCGQDKFWSFLKLLKKGRQRILTCKADAEKESQKLFKQIVAERQKAVAEFRQLHQFLEEQETLLLTQIEEMEEETARRRDEYMEKLSEELSSLDKVIQEMEEKCEQSASELLQDVRSTLRRCREKERFENPVAFPQSVKQRIWDFGDRNTFLEKAMKQFRDNLLFGFQLPQDDVTLDPDTAYPQLILAEDRKSVRWGEKWQDLPNNPERFSNFCFVLGCEGFTAGRHCWEVSVGSEGDWAVGVARKSVKRKGRFRWGPEEGVWAVMKWGGGYQALDSPADVPLHLSGEPKRIHVTLNCAEGQLAFLDADSDALIYTFFKASFSGETLLPFFWVGMKATLTLSP
ncbi:uncharacterized protein LOC128343940 [Hemicordylus capensis]|uniref:uncharacterized protein LOC128343940 n=1 Tax=Hemicordylus capensis TaxID=884348 RepID=UPI002303E144|nr:uncharacterized protein LOC128343940 [Hemicordylus capensis]